MMIKHIKYTVDAINTKGEIVFQAINQSYSDNSVIFTLPTDREISAVKLTWEYAEEEAHGNHRNN
jgi:hypothetical protein